jgi:PKD repeat protein
MKKFFLLSALAFAFHFSDACNAYFTHTYTCAGDTVFFQALDQAAVYTWDFGDTASGVANVSHDTSAWHVYSTPGTYFVTLFVNIGAEWDYRSQFITIGPGCFDAQFGVTCNYDTNLYFTNQSTGDYISVLWEFGDTASPNNTSTNISDMHQFSAPGVYNVTLIISDSTNSDTAVQQVNVSGHCISAQFFNFLGGDCVQDTVHVGISYGGDPASYYWDFGDPSTGSANNSTDSSGSHLFSAPGTYLVYVVASNAAETDTFYTIQNIIDCDVWPGNINTDGEVNMEDLFAIGIYFGDTGTARASVSNAWAAQAATNWNSNGSGFMYLQDLVDMKHADCNGDGIINSLDITALNQNYGMQLPNYPHNDLIQMMPVAAGDPVLQVLTQPSYNGAMNVSLPIDLSGSPNVADVYGVAARIYYDPALVVAGSVGLTFTGSWLGTTGIDMITLVKDDSVNGYVDFGIVRTDKTGVLGNGPIAWLNFTLAQNSGVMNLNIDPVIRLISNGLPLNQEIFKPVSKQDNQFAFLNVSVDEKGKSFLNVFPNPATGILTISSTNESIVKITLTDITGAEYLVNNFSGESFVEKIDVKDIPAGIYLIKVETKNGIKNGRIVIE